MVTFIILWGFWEKGFNYLNFALQIKKWVSAFEEQILVIV